MKSREKASEYHEEFADKASEDSDSDNETSSESDFEPLKNSRRKVPEHQGQSSEESSEESDVELALAVIKWLRVVGGSALKEGRRFPQITSTLSHQSVRDLIPGTLYSMENSVVAKTYQDPLPFAGLADTVVINDDHGTKIKINGLAKFKVTKVFSFKNSKAPNLKALVDLVDDGDYMIRLVPTLPIYTICWFSHDVLKSIQTGDFIVLVNPELLTKQFQDTNYYEVNFGDAIPKKGSGFYTIQNRNLVQGVPVFNCI